jgi:hypothetical protein
LIVLLCQGIGMRSAHTVNECLELGAYEGLAEDEAKRFGSTFEEDIEAATVATLHGAGISVMITRAQDEVRYTFISGNKRFTISGVEGGLPRWMEWS